MKADKAGNRINPKRKRSTKMKTILKDALKIYELYDQLVWIDAADSGCEVEEFSDYHIAKEAEWKLFCYIGDDTLYAEELAGEWSHEAMLDARKTVRQLKAFIKKYPKDQQSHEGKTIQ